MKGLPIGVALELCPAGSTEGLYPRRTQQGDALGELGLVLIVQQRENPVEQPCFLERMKQGKHVLLKSAAVVWALGAWVRAMLLCWARHSFDKRTMRAHTCLSCHKEIVGLKRSCCARAMHDMAKTAIPVFIAFAGYIFTVIHSRIVEQRGHRIERVNDQVR